MQQICKHFCKRPYNCNVGFEGHKIDLCFNDSAILMKCENDHRQYVNE